VQLCDCSGFGVHTGRKRSYFSTLLTKDVDAIRDYIPSKARAHGNIRQLQQVVCVCM
jgi:hypothetical protein